MSSDPVPVVSTPEVPAPPVAQVPAIVETPAGPATPARTCANCAAPLTGEYCPACGQHDEPHVHSVRHFFAEAFESITHADSRLWRTLGYLLARPGRLTLEFFKGHRVSYLPPFRLYLVISLVFFLVVDLPESVDVEIEPNASAEGVQGMNAAAGALEKEFADVPGASQAAAAIREQAASDADKLAGKPPRPQGMQENNLLTEICKEFKKADPAAGENYAQMQAVCNMPAEQRAKAIGEAMVRNIPRAMFVFLPLLALAMKFLYWRPKRYYVEHLLLLVHNHAFVFLALTILYLLQRIPVVGEHLGALEFAVWCYIIWYVFRAMRVYYSQSRALTFGKYVTMGIAYFSTTVMVLALMSMLILFTL